MTRTYIEYFTSWVLLKRGYDHCSPSKVEVARMVLHKELHPLTVWRGELKALMSNMSKPQFPSLAAYLFAVLMSEVIKYENPISSEAELVQIIERDSFSATVTTREEPIQMPTRPGITREKGEGAIPLRTLRHPAIESQGSLRQKRRRELLTSSDEEDKDEEESESASQEEGTRKRNPRSYSSKIGTSSRKGPHQAKD